MDILVSIQNKDAPFILKLLKNLKPRVRINPLTTQDRQVLESVQKGIEELKAIKAGKIKGITKKEAIDELRSSVDSRITERGLKNTHLLQKTYYN